MIWDLAPLSIFMGEQNIPPGCDIELLLTPFGGNQYKNNAIDSLTAQTQGTDFDFVVDDQIFYARLSKDLVSMKELLLST